jgi:hypothetical protein
MRADLTGIKSGFDPVPAGTYICRVTKVDDTETKNDGKMPAGTPGINVEFTVIAGDHEGRKFFNNYWVWPTTLPMLKGFLAATGEFDAEQLDGEIDFDNDQLIGTELKVAVNVQPETQQYDARNNVRRVKALTDEESEELESALP